MKFTAIDDSIVLTMFPTKVDDFHDAGGLGPSFLPDGAQPVVGTEYSVDIFEDIVIVAYPKFGPNLKTNFEFEYRVSGEVNMVILQLAQYVG